jgi:hypothetical protein
VDVREPELTGVARLRAAYEAKARAELADADGTVGAAPGSWDGPVVGARIVFLVAHPARGRGKVAILGKGVADAVSKAAEALGSAGRVFILATRPADGAAADANAQRLRLALEAVDAPAIIALDLESAEDLAAAFGVGELRLGTPTRAYGRTLGSVGDFEASLHDEAAKARVWTTMKAIAADAGLKAKGRPKAPLARTEADPKAAEL